MYKRQILHFAFKGFNICFDRLKLLSFHVSELWFLWSGGILGSSGSWLYAAPCFRFLRPFFFFLPFFLSAQRIVAAVSYTHLDVYKRQGLNIAPETVKKLSKHPNIVGIKEASGDISQIARIAALCGKDFDLYSGNDDQTIPIMSLGGVGCISTAANIIPAEYHQMTADFLRGRYKSCLLYTSVNEFGIF